MTDTTPRPLLLDGTSLQTHRWNLESLGGVFGRPEARGGVASIPYQHGGFSTSPKFYHPRRFVMRHVVMGTDVNGGNTHVDGYWGQLYQNLDDLLELIDSSSAHVLTRTLANGMTRTLDVEVLSAVPVGTLYKDKMYVVGASYVAPRPLWSELPVEQDVESAISAFPFAYTIVTGGNTDIVDAKFTVTCVVAGANPYLEATVAGDRISFSGSFVAADVIVVDLDQSVFTLNGVATAVVRKNRAWFMRLAHGQPALGLEFGADSGTWDVQIDWSDKWL